MEGGIGGLLGGIFMRGNKSIFLRQGALRSLYRLMRKKPLIRWSGGFLFAALEKYGFVSGFVKWVKIIYFNPKAAIITMGIISSKKRKQK